MNTIPTQSYRVPHHPRLSAARCPVTGGWTVTDMETGVTARAQSFEHARRSVVAAVERERADGPARAWLV